MDSEASSVNQGSVVFHRLSPALVPALLISINYVDPGKWAAAVDVGSRFGLDLVAWVFIFGFAAILCQYLSARIGVVTGRDLAQICHDEYDKNLSILLGIQIEFAKIALDMTRVMGIAHGINLLFGVDMFTCVLLTGIDAVFYPLVASFLENSKTKLYCILMAGFVLCAYVFGVLLSQPEGSESVGGGYNDSAESTFALMTLLGASILPQNFYLHSALVRNQNRGTPSKSKDALSQEHFFATFCIYSCTSLATYVLMNSAAYMFTSHDALTLVEQVFRIPVASFFFLLVLFGSTQVTALSWGLTGEVILQDIFRLDIPSWLHRVTIRIIAIVPAVYCVRTTGAEGIYQLFTFMQVIIAMLLPSAVIPLFRVASSKSLMSVHKMSQIVGFLALAVFSGMLCLNVMFLVELMFGTSDGAENVWWDFDGTSSFGYVLLLVIGWLSLGLTLWLLATPLKSASTQLDAQASTLNLQISVPEGYTDRERRDSEKDRFFGDSEKDRFFGDSEKDRFFGDSEKDRFFGDERVEERDLAVESYPLRHGFVSSDVGPEPEPEPKPEPEPEPERHLTTIEEDLNFAEELPKHVQVSSLPAETTEIPVTSTKPEAAQTVEKTVEIKRDGGDVYSWEPEKSQNSSSPIVSSDGPGSFRSLKGDDCGSGAGSLSRLAGLGRAARRQLAAALDEFWGQLFDFHGQMTQEARTRKLDLLLGIEPKSATSASRPDTSKPGDYNFVSSMNSSLLDSSDQPPRMSGNQVPSLWGNQARLLDEYAHRTGPTECGERRYSSLRLPPSSEGLYNQPATIRSHQPATIHGHQLATYLKQMQRNPDQFMRQGDIPVQKSLIMGPPGYTDARPYLGQRLQNGLSPRYQSVHANSDVATNGPPSPGPTNTGQQPVNTKKYHSLPDISGISVLQRGLHGSHHRTPYEPSMLSNSALRGGSHLAFDDLSPSGKYRDALSRQLVMSSSDTASLWSRQPFEQFGVAEKVRSVGGVIGDKLDLMATVDTEAALLKSLRQCILKLLKLEGSDWLFKQNDGADEELIERVAAREKLVLEVENRVVGGSANLMVSSLPHCGDGCIWKADLVVSFGVWCIHRVLDLSLMESRPELWGKYTYVLNRLQGVIEPAFSKPRVPSSPCFCLQLPGSNSQPFGAPLSGSNGMLPPTSKPGRGKCTNSTMLLDIIKDVEIAISSRKGRTGTAAGDVAFPKGKENLASVLKRYKRRLASNRPSSGGSDGPGSRKGQMSSPYCT